MTGLIECKCGTTHSVVMTNELICGCGRLYNELGVWLREDAVPEAGVVPGDSDARDGDVMTSDSIRETCEHLEALGVSADVLAPVYAYADSLDYCPSMDPDPGAYCRET